VSPRRWVRKQAEEIKAERAEVQIERGSLKDLIHDVADVVIALRVATEDLEQALRELAQREEEDERPDGGSVER
jgi:vacuolar-type H+-ATPase subunit I/STV1